MTKELIDQLSPVVTFGSLFIFWSMDLFAFGKSRTPGVVKHGVHNILMMILFIIANIILSVSLTGFNGWVTDEKIGLLNMVRLPSWLHLLVSILLIDFVGYWTHVFRHRSGFFWRFHRIHHSDDRPDATTSGRFHPGEMILNAITIMVSTVLLGFSEYAIALYFLLITPWTTFQHSGIRLPGWLDRALSFILMTPNVHRVHHSAEQSQTDSNYSDFFSFWDRLFGSFYYPEMEEPIVYGLKEFNADESTTVWQQLRMPFVKKQSAKRG